MEDLFECVEIVTMARGVLTPIDARLASRLEKVSDALSAFSMNMDLESLESDQDLLGADPAGQETEESREMATEGHEHDPFDLLSDFPVSSSSRKSTESRKVRDSDEDDGIVDIVTGEKIK